MGPKTEKCLHDGPNDSKSAADYGHFLCKDGRGSDEVTVTFIFYLFTYFTYFIFHSFLLIYLTLLFLFNYLLLLLNDYFK